MPRADVLVRVEGIASVVEGRALAERLMEQAGIVAARSLERGGGRLLHVDYQPGMLRPSGVLALVRSLGRQGRITGL